MPIKLTQREVLKQFRKIHGNKYDYSNVNYINTRTKVLIRCKDHGEFEQTPSCHIMGKGCYQCGIEKHRKALTFTKKKVIKKFIKTHDNRYDYLNVNYINMNTKVIITCKTHGDFKQRPDIHIAGQGCPSCSKSKGELTILRYLNNIKCKFIEEKQFKTLVSDLGYSLRYDFYLPKQSILIEFDGKQHRKRNKLWMSKEAFIKLQYHDQLKNDYAKHNGIQLIRITDIDDVNKTLTKHLL